MDGRGRGMDNVFIERLWRSLKYEEFIPATPRPRTAGAGSPTIPFYNHQRPHQALGYRTPMAVWREATAGGEAVDMMDNASALPTCPQPQQQTQPLAA